MRWATVATIDMGRKEGGCCALFAGELGPRLTQCGLGQGLLPYQAVSSSIQPFGHNKHGRKLGSCAPFRGAATPSNTKSLGPMFTSVPSGILIIQTTIDMGQKLGAWLCLFLGELFPNRTQSRLGRGLYSYQVAC